MNKENPLPLEVTIRPLSHGRDLPLPAYATEESAGLDLLAALKDEMTLEPGQRGLVPTGFALALPLGYEAQIRPRSGLALKYGITVLNAPGTIDADYRGEVGVMLINHGEASFTITRGMRIAQMLIAPVSRISWKKEEELEPTARGEGGYGSTGEDISQELNAGAPGK